MFVRTSLIKCFRSSYHYGRIEVHLLGGFSTGTPKKYRTVYESYRPETKLYVQSLYHSENFREDNENSANFEANQSCEIFIRASTRCKIYEKIKLHLFTDFCVIIRQHATYFSCCSLLRQLLKLENVLN